VSRAPAAAGRRGKLPAGSLRIGAGRLRGRLLAVPVSARPSAARLRGAVLDAAQNLLLGARVLDVFAGSGACGIEAISRGARAAVFLERDPQALRALRANAALCEPDECRIVAGDALRSLAALERAGERFELVFADPPYAELEPAPLLAALAPLVAPGGRVALEHDRRRELPERVGTLRQVARRAYGEGAVSWYEPEEDESLTGAT
jgi:16S rRNA (guanine966-N2)-methyltransferase